MNQAGIFFHPSSFRPQPFRLRYGLRQGDPDNKNGPMGHQYFWANQRDVLNGTTNRDNTVLRWVAHLQNDFKARLNCCAAPRFADANHEPIPHCQGDATRRVQEIEATVGKPYRLIASGSTDPDGHGLSYRWYVYPEAGTYSGPTTCTGPSSCRCRRKCAAPRSWNRRRWRGLRRGGGSDIRLHRARPGGAHD